MNHIEKLKELYEETDGANWILGYSKHRRKYSLTVGTKHFYNENMEAVLQAGIDYIKAKRKDKIHEKYTMFR